VWSFLQPFLFQFLDGILPLIEDHKESFDENYIRDYIDAFLYEQKIGKDPGFSVSFGFEIILLSVSLYVKNTALQQKGLYKDQANYFKDGISLT